MRRKICHDQNDTSYAKLKKASKTPAGAARTDKVVQRCAATLL
jgi:hypothetical protein